MKSDEILELLEADPFNRRPAVSLVSAKAPATELLRALDDARDPTLRQIICDILGNRHETSAVDALVDALSDNNLKVRASAADALAKIGDPRHGARVLDRFTQEEEVSVRQMLALTLGAIGYEPAAPDLIAALEQDDPILRGCAAWSLGELRITAAEGPLKRALSLETNSYAKSRMIDALGKIGSS